ncbi:MAG: phage tail tip lysozyme [Clostridium sp.]|nr:phage tail tip lysozyme [Clostridium sp.]
MAENMTDNARYIYSFFRARGWTSNAICGMLGNMQGESGIIADLDEYGGGGGYGLVQWTPKSNLTNWANANGLDYRTVDTQCRRIQWELENGQQFYATSAYPMNFRQFTQSTSSPTYLAKVFINNYERPANPDQPQRGVWAEEWYSFFGGGGSTVTINVTYQTYDDVTRIWLPNVVNTTDYAGIYGHDVDCVYASLSSGNIYYKVHVKGGSWLAEVANRSDYAGIKGQPIDALMVKTDTGKTVHYRVHLRTTGTWLPYVTGYNSADGNNGYAGIFGQPIDAIQIYLD